MGSGVKAIAYSVDSLTTGSNIKERRSAKISPPQFSSSFSAEISEAAVLGSVIL